MAAVADRAGVAAGTAYVHYGSKDELVIATYVELKRALGYAGASAVDVDAPPAERFRSLWRGIYRHLADDPDRSRFLIQVEASLYAADAHAAAMDEPDDPLLGAASAEDMQAQLADLPDQVRYDLAIGPAVRLVARQDALDADALERIAQACWRAITSP